MRAFRDRYYSQVDRILYISNIINKLDPGGTTCATYVAGTCPSSPGQRPRIKNRSYEFAIYLVDNMFMRSDFAGGFGTEDRRVSLQWKRGERRQDPRGVMVFNEVMSVSGAADKWKPWVTGRHFVWGWTTGVGPGNNQTPETSS
jgi:hypothetical protein